jgi:hypothetical protein
MFDRYCIALLVTALYALVLSPILSHAQSAWSAENGATITSDTPYGTSLVSTGDETPGGPQNKGFWNKLWNYMTDEANLTLGYGILEADLTVKRKSDGANATMSQRDTSTIFLVYSTRPSFFKDSNFGYTFMINYVAFDMGEQEISRNEFANLGTHVTGSMIYAVPTLYYQWGEHRYTGRFVRLGVGAGVGAATYSGTVQLTGSQVPGGEIVHTSNSSYEPRLALSNFLEARWNHFGISMSYVAPRIYGDNYDIKVSNFSVNVGYTYYF